MGQRLEICIMDNDDELANSYYHWSAYTSCAMELAKEIIINYYCRRARSKDKLKNAIRLLELTGAGVTSDEKTYLKKDNRFKNYKFGECTGRNTGLIAVSKEGMQDTRDWQEGLICIDISQERILFDVWSTYDDTSIKEYYPDEKIEPEEVDRSLSDWMSFQDFMSLASSYESTKWYKYGDTYYTGIE